MGSPAVSTELNKMGFDNIGCGKGTTHIYNYLIRKIYHENIKLILERPSQFDINKHFNFTDQLVLENLSY